MPIDEYGPGIVEAIRRVVIKNPEFTEHAERLAEALEFLKTFATKEQYEAWVKPLTQKLREGAAVGKLERKARAH